MISATSLEKEWIIKTAKARKSDPILVEKVIRALYLLEQLTQYKLSFIFKGGTALMLLLPEPKRFSIDIDIIMSKRPKNLNEIFDTIISNTDFTSYSQDERPSKSRIVKEHYKFYYEPVTATRDTKEYILLDILYEDSHYEKHTMAIEINSIFLQTAGENALVTVPTADAILGDKLTAFAPNTTGVPFGRDKQVEIIKQLFDIGHLFDIAEDCTIIRQIFNRFAQTELDYRVLEDLTCDDVLKDIENISICIATSGKGGDGNFPELHTGIRNIKNFIFSENFHIQAALVPAAKAAYVAALLKTESTEIQRFKDPSEIKDWMIDQTYENRLNKLKKSNPEAFFYWYQTYLLLCDVEV